MVSRSTIRLRSSFRHQAARPILDSHSASLSGVSLTGTKPARLKMKTSEPTDTGCCRVRGSCCRTAGNRTNPGRSRQTPRLEACYATQNSMMSSSAYPDTGAGGVPAERCGARRSPLWKWWSSTRSTASPARSLPLGYRVETRRSRSSNQLAVARGPADREGCAKRDRAPRRFAGTAWWRKVDFPTRDTFAVLPSAQSEVSRTTEKPLRRLRAKPDKKVVDH